MIQEEINIFCFLLQLSAAFNTVDHAIMLSVLRSPFGITDLLLNGLNRILRIVAERYICEDISTERLVNFSVPQGSCCGPVLFTLYIYASSIFNIVRQHAPTAAGYADDHRLMLAFKMTDEMSEALAITEMER